MFTKIYSNPTYQLGYVSYAPAAQSLLESLLGSDYLFTHSTVNSYRQKLNETDSQYELTLDLPGYGKGEVNVEVKDYVLTVTAENKVKGKITRDVSLWDDVDVSKVTGKIENGVLTVTLPKVEQVKPRKIEVK